MKKNVGGRDRIYRLIGGGVLTLVGLYGISGTISFAALSLPQTPTAAVLAVTGVALLATGVLQRCSVNKLLNRNTYRFKR